uniref:HORMA domain-containing protein n=1 Tax=Physcomitrium patens TaxID=3218 RepID=A0A7I4DVC1_PHYPA
MTLLRVEATPAEATRQWKEVSEAESLQLTRNLLRIAVFNISYIRGLFPDSFFQDKFVPALGKHSGHFSSLWSVQPSQYFLEQAGRTVSAELYLFFLGVMNVYFVHRYLCDCLTDCNLAACEFYDMQSIFFKSRSKSDVRNAVTEMNVKKLQPKDMESKRFIEWIEKVSFKYSAKGPSEDITSMTIESVSGKPVRTDTTNQTTPQQMKQSACKMVRTLVQLMHTLDHVPKERTIIMKLHYYDDVTPEDYEPPFFSSSTYEDPSPWAGEPLKMKVGYVDSRHYKLAIKVKSVLDPCEDENELAKNEMCSGTDVMVTSDDDSSTSSGANDDNTEPSQKSQPRGDVAIQSPENKEQLESFDEETSLANKFKKMRTTAAVAHISDTDRTEDSEFEAESLRSVRIYLQNREDKTVHMNDIMKEFPQISKVVMGELLDRLVEEEVLIRLKKDLFRVKKIQINPKERTKYSNETLQHNGINCKSLTSNVKPNKIPVPTQKANESLPDEQQGLYEKALLVTLPREYIAVAQLQEAFQDLSPGKIRQLISRMWLDGYIEKVPHIRCKGRQVFHTPATNKKLHELRVSYCSKMQKDEPGRKKYDNMDASQDWGVLIREKAQSRTLDELVCGRTQALGSDDTRQDQPAVKKHTKMAPAFKEPALPQKPLRERAKITPSTLGAKGKRIRVLNSDSLMNVNKDSQGEVVDRAGKASKVLSK